MIQLQPKSADREAWFTLAEKEKFGIEVLEFSSEYAGRTVPAEIFSRYCSFGKTDSLHGAFMDCCPLSPDAGIRELSRQRCEESCRQAITLGAKNIVFHSTALPFVRGGLEKMWAHDAADYYSALAERFNVKIFIENFNDPDPLPMVLMAQQADKDRVRLCFDVGHANFSRTDIKAWLDQAGEYIGYLHLSDNCGFWDDHLAPGDGSADIASLNAWWRTIKEDIPMTIEVGSIEKAEKAIKYLKNNSFFGL